MNTHLNPKALKKANDAAMHLAKAASLMREAAEISSTHVLSGRYDYLDWAAKIEEILSSDNGEAGVGPALQNWAAEMTRPEPKTYAHRKSDGTIVRVTIPE